MQTLGDVLLTDLSTSSAHATDAPEVNVVVLHRVLVAGAEYAQLPTRHDQLLEVMTLPAVDHVQQAVEVVLLFPVYTPKTYVAAMNSQ